MAKRIFTRTPSLQSPRGTFGTQEKVGTPSKPATQPASEVKGPGVQAQPPVAARAHSGLSEDAHTLIAKRAYEIWKSEGGAELDNWLRAEREVSSQIPAMR